MDKEEKKGSKLDNKYIPEYPAVKIGRLGRHKKYKNIKIGGEILMWGIGYIESLSEKLGVRFVTVDAYPKLVKWYEEFGFKRNLHENYDRKINVSMRYDLYNPQR